nr:N-acetylmuramoyl-L-alanine amidase [Virgibacillus doumboii]
MEKDLNLSISLYQYERYRELGIPVAITRTTDVTLTPDERTRIVRESGATYCHSNHINAGGGDGGEIIHSIYGGKGMAEQIADELRNAGQNIRRVFTRTLPNNTSRDFYFMNRNTGKVVTNIIEYGFADSNGDDIRQLNNHWQDYAEAVVKAFCIFSEYPYDNGKGKPANGEKNKYLHLPASDDTWRVYPLDAHPVKANEKGFLRPSKFGGLTYEVLGSSQPHVYLIQTRDFGKVQIYAHPKTGATFTHK